MSEHYELIVIGTGPAGEKAAVKAAYFGHKVAIIDKQRQLGGAAVVTGTLPSKTLKETALYLSGSQDKGLYGIEKSFNRSCSVADFMRRKNTVSSEASYDVEINLVNHKVDRYIGEAAFVDANTVAVKNKRGEKILKGDYIIIATGSYPVHPENIPFDGDLIHDSDTILDIDRFPKSMVIVGAGVIGCEYTTIFSTMGTKVHLINRVDKILTFIDHEISQELVSQMRQGGVEIHFNTSIKAVEADYEDNVARVTLQNGSILEVDMFLFAAGRSGQISGLNLEAAGVKTGPRETVLVDDCYRTNIPNIYAVGDVIGFPSLASTSMDQGRVAVAHIFQTVDLDHISTLFPLGIYTIPEVSAVGLTEEEAREKEGRYMTGKVYHNNVPRGKILGMTSNGFLKIVFNAESEEIVGVHCIGPLATELIHFGLLLIESKKTLKDVIRMVFNYPTFHELYKYAAYDGLSNLSGYKVKR